MAAAAGCRVAAAMQRALQGSANDRGGRAMARFFRQLFRRLGTGIEDIAVL